MNIIRNKIIEHLPKPNRRLPTSWYSYNCPYCVVNGQPRPDTRMRGGLLPTGTGGFVINCFNCKFKTGWAPGLPIRDKLKEYLKSMNMNEQDIKNLSFVAHQMDGDGIINDGAEKDHWYPKFEKEELPKNAKPFSYWLSKDNPPPGFVKVLENMYGKRGLETLESYDFYWSPITYKEMNKRVIVPFYWNDTIVGYTSRHIGNHVQRYYEKSPRHYIFNCKALENKSRKYVVLTEGVFDCIGIDGCAVLGSTLTDEQVHWIKASEKEVIVVPDNDRASRSLVSVAVKHGWSVCFLKLGDDINDLGDAIKKFGKLFCLRYILENRMSDPTKIELMSKFRLT